MDLIYQLYEIFMKKGFKTEEIYNNHINKENTI